MRSTRSLRIAVALALAALAAASTDCGRKTAVEEHAIAEIASVAERIDAAIDQTLSGAFGARISGEHTGSIQIERDSDGDVWTIASDPEFQQEAETRVVNQYVFTRFSRSSTFLRQPLKPQESLDLASAFLLALKRHARFHTTADNEIAYHVENHPLESGAAEGTISLGQRRIRKISARTTESAVIFEFDYESIDDIRAPDSFDAHQG